MNCISVFFVTVLLSICCDPSHAGWIVKQATDEWEIAHIEEIALDGGSMKILCVGPDGQREWIVGVKALVHSDKAGIPESLQKRVRTKATAKVLNRVLDTVTYSWKVEIWNETREPKEYSALTVKFVDAKGFVVHQDHSFDDIVLAPGEYRSISDQGVTSIDIFDQMKNYEVELK